MSRRIEITIPNSWAPAVRELLEDPNGCGLGDSSDKPNMVVELSGPTKTLIFVTLPGPAVAGVLEILRKHGFGVKVGRIVLSSMDYMKPDLSKPLEPPETEEMAEVYKKRAAKALKGVAQFMKARRTTEELFNEISNNAKMTINTWLNLIGASIIAGGGLATNTTVFIVASMLVSPIMGPILGMTFGYRVADWPLFKTGFWSEFKMALATFTVGIFIGLILGDVGDTYKWPNSAMMPEGQAFNLVISIIVSAAAGMVLAVSLSSPVANALVGTAISAGLLPPLVNAGMLIAYSCTYAPLSKRADLYEMGNYAILFYLSHVITIIVCANFIFWLKDIDPRFRQGDDADFHDIPTLRKHREKLLTEGKADQGEREKFKDFMRNAINDLKQDTVGGLLDIRDNALGVVNKLKDVVEGGSGTQSTQNPTTHGGNPPHTPSSRVRTQSYTAEKELLSSRDLEAGGGGEDETEEGGISQNRFFKRHVIQVSPNELAERMLEEQITPDLLTKYTPVSAIEDDHTNTVLNPLVHSSTSSSGISNNSNTNEESLINTGRSKTSMVTSSPLDTHITSSSSSAAAV